jgi:hypothetical protein
MVIFLLISCQNKSTEIIPITADAGDTTIFLPLIINGITQPPVEPLDVPLIHFPYKNVENFASDAFSEMTVFWLGKVAINENYTDVRIGYNQSKLYVFLASFDRLLWYDASPAPDTIDEWDSVSLFIQPSGGNQLVADGAYKLDAALAPLEASRSLYQSVSVWNGSSWDGWTVPFTSSTQWRGDGLNNSNDDQGWNIIYEIPFASVGLSSPPPQNTEWRFAITVNDRDYLDGKIIESKSWPDTFEDDSSNGWGKGYFGLLNSTSSSDTPEGIIIVREGLDNTIVPDVSPGGYSTCGDGLNFWTEWGEKVYQGDAVYTAVVQNQRDIADWPCFSKYFVKFPLDKIPFGKSILDAKLTMHLFGNSGEWGDPVFQPYRSLIQLSITDSNWNESTLNWNNAPKVKENISRTFVDPIEIFPGWPGVPYDWDLTYAIQQAYQNGDQEISLVLYSADGAYHSGKYFSTSEAENWNAIARPTLTISYGNATP